MQQLRIPSSDASGFNQVRYVGNGTPAKTSPAAEDYLRLLQRIVTIEATPWHCRIIENEANPTWSKMRLSKMQGQILETAYAVYASVPFCRYNACRHFITDSSALCSGGQVLDVSRRKVKVVNVRKLVMDPA